MRCLIIVVGVTATALAGCDSDHSSIAIGNAAAAALQTPDASTAVQQKRIVLEDHIWIPVADELDQRLKQVRKAAEADDPKVAISQLSHATAFLEMQLDAATEAQKQRVSQAIKRLKQLAQQINSSKKPTANDYADAFQLARAADLAQRWVHVEELTHIPYADKVTDRLSKAGQQLESHDLEALTANLNRSAALLMLEVPNAEGRTKVALRESAKNLKHLATQLKNGEHVDADTLARAVEYASSSLAIQHREMADLPEQRSTIPEDKKARRFATIRLEYVPQAGAPKPAETDKQAETDQADIDEARRLADQMIKGSMQLDDELDTLLQSIDREIERIGDQIKATEG